MTVSAIITCFNQGRYLFEAITSVLGQHPAPVELIVIDDGSTDDTPAIAARFTELRYIRQDNAGLSAARNKGLTAASQRNILFLDADDILSPGAVASSLAAFERSPDAAFVYGGHVEVEADRTLRRSWTPTPEEACFEALLRINVVRMHATVLYRRAILVEIGGFDATLRACEDYDVYLRIARRFEIASHASLIAEYRRHDANMSGDPIRMLKASTDVLKRQRPFVQSSPALRRAYRDGLSAWRAFYGGALLRQLQRDWWRPSRATRSLQGLMTGLACDPGFLWRAARKSFEAALFRGGRHRWTN